MVSSPVSSHDLTFVHSRFIDFSIATVSHRDRLYADWANPLMISSRCFTYLIPVPVWTWLPSAVYNHARSNTVFHILCINGGLGINFLRLAAINKPPNSSRCNKWLIS